jgi:flagellar basal-body rod protein FlgF
MDNALLIGLQTQRVLQRRMEATANNLANVSTNGFKADSILFEEDRGTAAHTQDRPTDVRFVDEYGVSRDMSQGAIAQTGNSFDVAIEGDGFFMVGGAGGPYYTRNGRFTLSADGALQTADGRPVLGQGGSPISFDPKGGAVKIDADGQITVSGGETGSIATNQVGQLAVARFPHPGALAKTGDNLYTANGVSPGPFTGRVVQGALETSNVRPIVELTRLIEISRAYESAAKIVSNGDDLRKNAIAKLAQTS